MSHWVATLLLRSACMTALLAVACSPGSGHAERVDVPLRVAVSLVKPATWDCHANRCRLHVKAAIANDGDEHAWAMFCRVVGVDADGAVVTSRVLPTGPAGFAVERTLDDRLHNAACVDAAGARREVLVRDVPCVHVARAGADLMATRRAIALLAVFGVVALLAGWVLFHVQRYRACIHYEGLRPSGPCDPSVYLPFAWVGIALWVAASIALLIVATWLIGIGIRGVIRHDARVRAAQRER